MCTYASVDEYEYALFPAGTLDVSQISYGGYSHPDSLVTDICPHGDIFAPFSGEIVYKDNTWGYVVLQSDNKVHWADGSLDYMSVGFMHDNDISDLYKGLKISQGTPFYQAGVKSPRNNVTGEHVHVVIMRGKLSSYNYYYSGTDYIFDAFSLIDSTTVIRSGQAGKGNKCTEYNAPTDYSTLWRYYSPSYNTYYFHFNPAGGSGFMGVKTADYGSLFTLPHCTYTRTGFDFLGWNVKRENDNKYYVRSVNGWFTETEIGANGYTKELYPDNASKYFDVSWTDGCDTKSIYTFYAVWKESSNRPISTLSVTGHEAGTPSGSLAQGASFGLRGTISSNYDITHVEAHIYDSNGNDVMTSYSKDGWNKTSYNIQTDGINDHFSFRSLEIGTYHYVVKATDSSGNAMKTLIDSWFAVGTSTPAQQYLDQCTSEPCDVTLTVTTTGNMKSMPCSVNTNAQSTTVESLIRGNTYPSKVRWKNTEGNIWFEVTGTTGQRGFIYIGDVSVTAIINHGDYYAPNINSNISISEYEAGTPSGTLTQGSNFGLRGIISSDYPITHVEAHIYKSDGTDALPYYSTSWNSTSYNIRTNGINDHFSFRNLGNGTNYNYTVLASDSSGATVTLIDSYFNVGASAPTVTKPEMPIVSVSSSQYTVGDSITISWTEAARNEYYWINVVKDGTKIVDQSMGTSLSYTLTNAQAGSYTVYVSANNSAGTSGSSNCSFSVNVIFDLNGCLDGNPECGSLEGYGTVDVYMNGTMVASGVGDYIASWPVGTRYEIRNIQAFDAKHYDGVYSGSLSGTIGTERVNVVLSFSTLYYLNLDGLLDGAANDGLGSYGMADIYINGSLVASGYNDYWYAWPVGTSYEIKNIRANDGYQYNGVYSGSLSGTIGTERVNVVLSFSSLVNLNVDGYLDGVLNGSLDKYGVVDVYINDTQFANGWTDYYAPWAIGTKYEIKNIRANDGYRYNGVYSGSLTGNIGTEQVNVVLSFSTVHTYAFDSNGGSGTMSSIQVAPDDPVIFPACTFTKKDAVFLGWQAYRPIDKKYAIEFVGWRTAEEMAAAGQIPTKYPAQYSFYQNSTWTEGTTGPITIILSPVWATPDFVFPDAVTTIGDEAFVGGAFNYVKLPDQIVSIGWHAFADCPNLAYVYIPALTTQIDDEAFGNMQGLTILGKTGSVAETYAQNHHFTFIAVP